MTTRQTKLAIITGGTKGFGKSIALRLGKDYELALLYKSDKKNAIDTQNELEMLYKKMFDVRIYQCDVSDLSQVTTTYLQIKNDFQKGASVLVNSAGIALKELFILENILDHKKSMDINYFGPIHMCKVVLSDMSRAKFGRIINLSSNNVSINNRGSSAYCASKAALEKFSQILGGEVSKLGITVNVIRPGISDTNMANNYLENLSKENYQELLAPSGELIDGNEIAKAVEFLIDSRQINSSTITVDTGHALFSKI